MENLREKAIKALNKKAIYGRDYDLNQFEEVSEEFNDISEVEKEYYKNLEKIGIENASYIQVNNKGYYKKGPVEISSIKEALRKYKWLRKYFFKLVKVDTDKYTAINYLKESDGYFVRVRKGVKVKIPLQTCLLLVGKGSMQLAHNIIIVEDNSELHLLTGCESVHNRKGIHIGVTEMYVGKNAKLSYTMIHSWGREIVVKPRTGALLNENAKLNYNYILLSETKEIQSYPSFVVKENAIVNSNSIVVGKGKSFIDLGSKALLYGGKAKLVSRGVVRDRAIVNFRAKLEGLKERSEGHVECSSMMLSNKAKVYTEPILESKFSNVSLTHEASIGRIRKDELEYLMSKGLNEEEATSLLLYGFLNLESKEMPSILKKQVNKIIKESLKGF